MAWFALAIALFASAVFAGAETGHYALSPLQLRHVARGRRRALIHLRLTQSSAGYLCALLIGNNLANDIAVHAAGDLFQSLPFANPHYVAAAVLTPVVFLLGEVIPKQWVLAKPLERSLLLTPLLLIARLALWPISALMAFTLSLFGLKEKDYRRKQLAALLATPSNETGNEGAVLSAARRALLSKGQGLTSFLRTIPVLKAETTLSQARAELAATADALALIERPGNSPGLLLGSRVALAADGALPQSIAREIPQLDASEDLSLVLERLRGLDSGFALLKEGPNWALLDLEHILGLLLTEDPPSS
ncbi:MAG: CNNM domain-containing protein [Planctomycetota bacterium]|jgi:hypothetical protein|nr:CNNM domain-containing protein [Planctomycetota bacterium]MDP6942164.1 CNNM domain-containing protein [Planctomycetota bacterium]